MSSGEPAPLPSPAPPARGRWGRRLRGCALVLGLPLGVLWAMMPRHPEDGLERLPGLLEFPDRVERHGRLTARSYARHGLGEGDDHFTILEIDGDPIELQGGHLATAGLCEACDGVRVADTALVYLYHRDPARRGWNAVQVVGDELRWTWLCAETEARMRLVNGKRVEEAPAIRWDGTRLELGCGVVFDAATGRIEGEESEAR